MVWNGDLGVRRSFVGGAVSLVTTLVTTPVIRQWLIRRGTVDVPNHRSSHSTPIPRGGGLACAAGVTLGLAAAGSESKVTSRALLGIGALAMTGFADDRLGNVHPAGRFAVQTIAGASFGHSPATAAMASLGTPGVVNVVNFMDGINGISGGTSAVWGLSTLAIGRREQDHALQTLGALTVGAGLGFLPWNAPTAKIFLGDVGSYLLGGLMAAGIAHASGNPRTAWQVASPLLPYGLDAAQALFLRAQRGEPLTEAHREHVYQRLVDEYRLSHMQVAALHTFVAWLVGFLARRQSPLSGVALSSVALAYVASPELLRWKRGMP